MKNTFCETFKKWKAVSRLLSFLLKKSDVRCQFWRRCVNPSSSVGITAKSSSTKQTNCNIKASYNTSQPTTSRRVEEARARSWQFEELSAGDALACLKSERLTSSQQPGMRAINRHTMPSVAFTRYSCSLKSFEKQTKEFHNNFYYCFIDLNWNPLRNFNPTFDCQNEKLFIAGSLALVFHYDAHYNHHIGTISRWAD